MKKLEPFVVEKLKEYGFGQEAVWDCHGAWVVYHKALEKIAAKEGITFQSPFIVEANGERGVAAVCVTGEMDGRMEWSIGEASPKNCTNKYPWAMAEKRAKDRVILKLIGLHGYIYSEDEIDEDDAIKKDSITKAKDAFRQFVRDLTDCSDLDSVIALEETTKSLRKRFEEVIPEWCAGTANQPSLDMRIEQRKKQLC